MGRGTIHRRVNGGGVEDAGASYPSTSCAGSPPQPNGWGGTTWNLAFLRRAATFVTMAPRSDAPLRAILGPTNTGKTHLAIDRMCGHSSGVIGFPLRRLAREVYDRVVA